jgi:hypothetical protein
MPYIIKQDRQPLIPLIEQVVSIICSENDLLVQADYLRYFIRQLRGLFSFGNYPCPDPAFVEVETLETLHKTASKIVEVISWEKDLLNQLGLLNYVSSAVIWGILGDSLSTKPARYGFRAYIKGILWGIYQEGTNTNDNRRAVGFQGVITDVIDEMYRRKTAIYEDEKIKLHGDIWPLRSVAWKEDVPLSISSADDFS